MKLKMATVHEPFFYPGVGTFPTGGHVLSSEDTNSSKGVKMELLEVEAVTLVKITVKDKVNKDVVILAPLTSFKMLVPA